MPDNKKLENLDKVEAPKYKSFSDISKEASNLALEVKNSYVAKKSPIISDSSIIDKANKVEAFIGEPWAFKDGLSSLEKAYAKSNYLEKKQLAEEQGWIGEYGGAVAQAVAGEIVLGTLEGLGYLFDFPAIQDKLNGTNQDWGNWLSDFAKQGKEAVRDFAPIHINPDNEGKFQPWSSEWWASNIPSIASTASIMLPVFGGLKAASLVGKGASLIGKSVAKTAILNDFTKVGNVLNKISDPIEALAKVNPGMASGLSKLGQGVAGGMMSRYTESMMESAGIYEEKYQEYINKGLSEEAAKTAASKGAAFAFRENLALLSTDIPQFVIASFLGFSPNKRITSYKHAIAEGASKSKALLLSMASPTANFAMEGFEEAFQFVVGEEGKYVADRTAFPDKYKERNDSYGAMFGRNWNDGQMWTNAFFGGLGGAVMSPMMRGSKKGWDYLTKSVDGSISENEARIHEVTNRFTNIQTHLNALKEAVAIGNERGALVARENMAVETAINASENGNLNSALNSIKHIANASPEELAANGFDMDNDTHKEFVKNANEYANKVDAIAREHAKNLQAFSRFGNAGKGYARALTKTKALTVNYEARQKELDTIIPQIEANILNNTTLSPEAKAIYDVKLQILTNKRIVNAAKALSKVAKDKEQKDLWTQKQEDVLNSINESEKLLKRLQQDNITNIQEQIVLDKLETEEGTELIKHKVEKSFIVDSIAQLVKDNKVFEDIKTGKITPEEYVKQYREKNDVSDSEGKTEETPISKADFELDEEAIETDEGEVIEEITVDYLKRNPVKLKSYLDAITSKELDLKDFPEKVQTFLEKQLSSNTEQEETENPAEEITNLETEVIDEIEVDDFNIIDNSNDEKDYDDEYEPFVNTTALNPLAWLSPFNEISTDTSENSKILSELIERGSDTFPIGFTVRYEINQEWINDNKSKYAKLLDSNGVLKSGLTPDEVGNVPIKALLYKDGKPYIVNNIHVSMNLHDIDFFQADNNEVRPSQIQKLKDDKQLILDSISKGIEVESKIEGLTGGTLNTKRDEDGKFATNKVSDVVGKSIENIQIVFGKGGGYYFGKIKKLPTLQGSKSGALYAIVNTANRTSFPLRLQSTKLTKDESTVIFTIIADYFKSGLTKIEADNKKLSKEVMDVIQNSKDPRVLGLLKYFITKDTTNEQLLDHLIYKVKDSKSSSLFNISIEEKTKMPILNVNIDGVKSKYTVLSTVNGNKGRIIDNLVNTRNRQIDVKLLENNEYKKYLNDNKVVTSNGAKNIDEPLFIQPVVKYEPIQLLQTPEVEKETNTQTTITKDTLEDKKDRINKSKKSIGFNYLTDEGYVGIYYTSDGKEIFIERATRALVVKEINSLYKSEVVALEQPQEVVENVIPESKETVIDVTNDVEVFEGESVSSFDIADTTEIEKNLAAFLGQTEAQVTEEVVEESVKEYTETEKLAIKLINKEINRSSLTVSQQEELAAYGVENLNKLKESIKKSKEAVTTPTMSKLDKINLKQQRYLEFEGKYKELFSTFDKENFNTWYSKFAINDTESSAEEILNKYKNCHK